MNKFKILLSIILSTILVSFGDSRDDDTWVVGTSADNPLYEFMQDGEIVGFDIDLMVAIGQHLGKNIEFRNMEFHGLLAALSSNNVDMVIAGMSVTPERQKRVTFSVPYTDARIAVLFRRSILGEEDSGLGKLGATVSCGVRHDCVHQNTFFRVMVGAYVLSSVIGDECLG